jgi:hypothetical protein
MLVPQVIRVDAGDDNGGDADAVVDIMLENLACKGSLRDGLRVRIER